MAQTDQERTQQPTQKRLRDALDKGQVPRSRDLNTFLIVIAGSVFLYALSSQILTCFMNIMHESLSPKVPSTISLDVIKATLFHAVYQAGLLFIPLLVALLIFSLLGPLLIGGFSFNFNNLAPKAERISPAKGIKRMFSLRSIVELIKALLKFSVIIGVAILVLWHQADDILHLEKLPLQTAMQHGMSDLLFAILVIASTLLLFTAIDVPYQLWEHFKKLKMTTQEIKEETKTTEGNPETRRRIRKQQIELAQNRMINEVKSANVVITNPTHFAIAVKYDQELQDTPRVVAKGVDLIAEQIRSHALANQIPLVSSPPLARSLYYFTPLYHEIPKGLYVAVAKILAYVYQLDRYNVGLASEPELPDGIDIPDELKK